MPLSFGTRLGPYEIVEPVGAGGMGEVYRAKDTRLNRTVAIKILPAHLSSSPASKQRFDREARTISNLSHPYICALHDVGHQDGIDYLVMEFLEGETLAQRLSKGPLSTELVFRYGIQIADALDKAHRKGIVHRDLKPGNVMITKLGAKLLDFGLAKLSENEPQLDSSVSQLNTQDHLTEEGLVVGTVQYMAPEQLEGRQVDYRTDIFALGAIIYETATGQEAFTGQSKASLISAILTSDPKPISVVQPLSPAVLDHLVKKCLAKDPEDRWQSAHDLGGELKWISETLGQSGSVVVEPKRKGRVWRLFLAICLIFIPLASLLLYFNNRGFPQKLMLVSIPVPPDSELVDTPVLSPDGSRIIFAAADKNGKVNLWMRSFQSTSSQKIPGTEHANYPFWSTDSQFIVFFSNGKMIKVDPSKGLSQVLAYVSDQRGGTWNKEGVILFTPNPGDGIYRIGSEGGAATRVTSLDPAALEVSHRFPYFLPDGKHFLFFVKAQKGETGIYIGSLGSQGKSFLVRSDRSAVFSSGYLLFQGSNSLLAQPFDPKKLKLSGQPVSLSENVWYEPVIWGSPTMSVSSNNLVTYIEGSNRSQLLWFDRDGKQQGAVSGPDLYASSPTFSPDGKRFAMQVIDGGFSHIWLYETSNGSRSRFTFSPSYNNDPVWSPDGNQILFSSTRNGTFSIYVKNASGAGNEEMLYQSSNWIFPQDWSPDNEHIIFTQVDPKTKYDLWILRFHEPKKAVPFLATDANEAHPRFSPDGKWVAYCSDESGQPEVYVQPFLVEKGGKWQVSPNGGYTPRWSKDGKQIFYLSLDNQIMSSDVKLGSTFEASAPRPLFAIHPYVLQRIANGFDAFEHAPDGRRFAVHAASSSPMNITVVLNWPLLLNPKKQD